MTTLKPGDEVRVFDHTDGRRVREYPGKVVKTGQALATISYGQKPYGREAKFRMDTGLINDNYGGAWFKTLEQAEADERAEAAKKVLKAAGFEIRLGRHPAPALIEALAEVVKTFGTGGEEG